LEEGKIIFFGSLGCQLVGTKSNAFPDDHIRRSVSVAVVGMSVF